MHSWTGSRICASPCSVVRSTAPLEEEGEAAGAAAAEVDAAVVDTIDVVMRAAFEAEVGVACE